MLDTIMDALFPSRIAIYKSRIAALDQKVDMLLEDLYRRAEEKFSAGGTDEFIPVPKFTQGSKKGKLIFCPHCGHSHKVYNFAWTELKCAHCGEETTKYNWLMRRKGR